MPTLYEIQLPAEVPNNVELPPVGNPAFASLALKYVNHWVNVWVPAFNTMNQTVCNNAQYAAQSAQFAGEAMSNAQAALAGARQAQSAAEKISGAKAWVAGGTWAVDAVVWGTEASGSPLYRCLVAHSGSSTPPSNDPVRWRFIGAVTSSDPTSGPTAQALVYDVQGRVTSRTFTQDGKDGIESLVWGVGGKLGSVSTTWSNRTRLVELIYDAAGNIVGDKVTNTQERLNASFRPGSYPSEWVLTSNAGVETSVLEDDSAATGYVLRSGDNNGNDCAWARYGALVPFDDTKLYRLRYRYRRVSGTGSVYLGLAVRNAANTNYVDTANKETAALSQSHYAISAATPALGEWQTGVVYYGGRSSGAASGSGTLASPKKLAALAGFITPMFVSNYSNLSGEVEFDYLIIDEIT